jgi:hypothetical protein
MKKLFHTVFEKCALVSVTAAISSAIVLHQQAEKPSKAIPDVLTTRSLVIVDEEGRPCVSLNAGHNGGRLEIFSPSKGDGKEGLIAYLGSAFGSEMQFILTEGKPEGKASVHMYVGGEPSYPRIVGTGGSGQSTFKLGAIGNGNPMFSLWQKSEKVPYFSK